MQNSVTRGLNIFLFLAKVVLIYVSTTMYSCFSPILMKFEYYIFKENFKFIGCFIIFFSYEGDLAFFVWGH